MKPSIIPVEAVRTDAAADSRASPLARLWRAQLLAALERLEHGELRLIDADGEYRFGRRSERYPLHVTLRIAHPGAYADIALGGSVGAGEAYIHGHWNCDNLTDLVRILILNRHVLEGLEGRFARLQRPLLRAFHFLNRNSRRGSARNIAAHYDLGNALYALMLDETMAYSCGIFEREDSTLARGLARQVRCGLPQARAQLQRPPARDRHRLGRPGAACRAALWLPRHHHDDLARPIRVCARAHRGCRVVRSRHAAARGLSRPARQLRQAGLDRDDRGRRGRATWTRTSAAAVRCWPTTAPCCCRRSRSRTRSTNPRSGRWTSSSATSSPAASFHRSPR